VILVAADRGDWILCQVTSKTYGDPRAVRIDPGDFAGGTLPLVSFARPAKLFTAHESLFVSEAGQLRDATLLQIRQAVFAVLS
jgi:mRNA interferase MazF